MKIFFEKFSKFKTELPVIEDRPLLSLQIPDSHTWLFKHFTSTGQFEQ